MQSFKRKSMSVCKSMCRSQSEKKSKPTIEQMMDSYVDNSHLSDVTFLVADKKICAHKLILSMSNAEFERMFFATDEERSDEILVLDCSYNGFLNLVRYLYTKKVQLDLSEICETYLAAKKYKELALIDDLTAYIGKRWLVLSNAAILYDQLSKVPVDDPLLKEVKPSIEKFLASLRRMIEISSQEVFQSECFKRISPTGLANLLKFEQLNISEFELLQACLQWVDEELRREQRELNSANRVELFKDLKHLIRFGDLNFEELGKLEIETYMTIDELGAVLLHLSNRSKPLGIEYRSPRDVFRKFSYSLLASTDGVMSGNFSTREVTFQLRVNKRISVESIEMQPLSVSDACFCRIYSDKNELDVKFVPRKSDTSWSIYFEEELLQLQPNVDYRLELKFTIPYQGKSENFYFGQLSFSKQLNLKNDEVQVACEIESGFGYHCIKSINFCQTN